MPATEAPHDPPAPHRDQMALSAREVVMTPLERCESEIAYFVMTGELSPYCDPAMPGAALSDAIGAVVGLTDWQMEADLIREMEGTRRRDWCQH
jgi:hypothetical protein